MKKFEYQVLTLEGLDIEDELNKYGQEGWELVAIDQRDNPPDVFNHNLETAPRLYRKARPGANYKWSL